MNQMPIKEAVRICRCSMTACDLPQSTTTTPFLPVVIPGCVSTPRVRNSPRKLPPNDYSVFFSFCLLWRSRIWHGVRATASSCLNDLTATGSSSYTLAEAEQYTRQYTCWRVATRKIQNGDEKDMAIHVVDQERFHKHLFSQNVLFYTLSGKNLR